MRKNYFNSELSYLIATVRINNCIPSFLGKKFQRYKCQLEQKNWYVYTFMNKLEYILPFWRLNRKTSITYYRNRRKYYYYKVRSNPWLRFSRELSLRILRVLNARHTIVNYMQWRIHCGNIYRRHNDRWGYLLSILRSFFVRFVCCCRSWCRSKLYTPSILNTDLVFWHPQWMQ